MTSVPSRCRHFLSSPHVLSCHTTLRVPPSTSFIGYADGASRYSRNLASAGWAIFTPLHDLVLSNGVCIGSATNNQAEYDAVRGLLADALLHRIRHLHVRLDSLLLVMQLNGVYRVHNPVLFRRYLRVKVLIRAFETITFNHVPRDQNHYVDSIANHVLDWHLSHTIHTRQ